MQTRLGFGRAALLRDVPDNADRLAGRAEDFKDDAREFAHATAAIFKLDLAELAQVIENAMQRQELVAAPVLDVHQVNSTVMARAVGRIGLGRDQQIGRQVPLNSRLNLVD
jgi:hypothetical protein